MVEREAHVPLPASDADLFSRKNGPPDFGEVPQEFSDARFHELNLFDNLSDFKFGG